MTSSLRTDSGCSFSNPVSHRGLLFSRESPRVVHCRIWPDSVWVHDSDAWDDVHDAQHGVRATVDPGLTAVASGVEGCRCERFGSSCRRPSGIGPWWTTSIGSSEMWTNICDTF